MQTCKFARQLIASYRHVSVQPKVYLDAIFVLLFSNITQQRDGELWVKNIYTIERADKFVCPNNFYI